MMLPWRSGISSSAARDLRRPRDDEKQHVHAGAIVLHAVGQRRGIARPTVCILSGDKQSDGVETARDAPPHLPQPDNATGRHSAAFKSASVAMALFDRGKETTSPVAADTSAPR